MIKKLVAPSLTFGRPPLFEGRFFLFCLGGETVKLAKGGRAKKGKEGVVVHATIPKYQYEAIKKLEGTLGTSENGVIANIIGMWLSSQDWFMDLIKHKVKERPL